MEATQTREHVYGGVRRIYPGGVYHSTPSVFERVEDENIRVAESLRYYPYRATFDFECWFDTEQLPSDSDQVRASEMSRHEWRHQQVGERHDGYTAIDE